MLELRSNRLDLRIQITNNLFLCYFSTGSAKCRYVEAGPLAQWLNDHQRDPRLNEILFPMYDHKQTQQLIETFEMNSDYAKRGKRLLYNSLYFKLLRVLLLVNKYIDSGLFNTACVAVLLFLRMA